MTTRTWARTAAAAVAAGAQLAALGAANIVTNPDDVWGWVMFIGSGPVIIFGVRVAIDLRQEGSDQ